jgi:CO dehydrogenase maturation factor
VGKSCVAGTLARVLARRGHSVIAIDSDPMPGLAISLGLGSPTDAMLTDAADKDPSGRWRLKRGVGPATAIMRYSAVAPDGVRFLQFGKASTGGLQPFMGSLNALYETVHRLSREGVLRCWTVIGDLPAGPRQTAFNWAPYAEALVTVVEPTWPSVLTGKRIARIARSRSNGVVVLVVANKVRSDRDLDFVEQQMDEQILAGLPLDPSVAGAEASGMAPIDYAPGSPYVLAIEELALLLERRRLERSACADERR